MEANWSLFSLNNNTEMPALGLTLIDCDDASIKLLINQAISLGYRSFDITNITNNSHLADVFKELLPMYELHRDDIYVIRRLKSHESYSANTIETVYSNTTKNLGMDYIDLLLLQRPSPSVSFNAKRKAICNKAWEKFNKIYDEGRVNAIGVSNFSAKQLKGLIKENHGGAPAVYMFSDWHPENQNRDVIKICRENEIVVQAINACIPDGKGWSPSFYSTLSKIASAIDKTPYQVQLVWNLQNDIASLVQTSEPDQIRESFELEFQLTTAQMNSLDRVASKMK